MVVLCVAVDLCQLDADVSGAVASAWSSNTLSTRNSQWSRFLKFCAANTLTPLPASAHTVARFLVWQAKSSKFVTVNNYLSAIISLHRFYGHEVDFRNQFLIQLVLKGLKAQLGQETKQMQPLSVAQLNDIYIKLDKSVDLNLTLWTAIILSFRTLLRKSNIVPDSPSSMSHVLRRKDVTFHSWGMMVHVHSTKTLRHKEEVLEIPVSYTGNQVFCAGTALRYHMERYPAAQDSPLLLKVGSNGLVPILYGELQKFIKTCVRSIGLDPDMYGSHSLRRSGALYLHSLGVPLEDIMCAGHWKSLAVLAYLATPPDRKRFIQDCVAVALISG